MSAAMVELGLPTDAPGDFSHCDTSSMMSQPPETHLPASKLRLRPPHPAQRGLATRPRANSTCRNEPPGMLLTKRLPSKSVSEMKMGAAGGCTWNRGVMFSELGGLTPSYLVKKCYEPLGRDNSTLSDPLGFLLLGHGICIAVNLREIL